MDMHTLKLTKDELTLLEQALDNLHGTLGRQMHDVPERAESVRQAYLQNMAQVRQLRATVVRAR
jgi:hypothetical protein